MSSILQALQPNILGYYPFSVGTGSTVYDYKNSKNGTISGATFTKLVDGSYALTFNGSSDSVYNSGDALDSLTDAYSISVWFKSTETNSAEALVSYADNSTGISYFNWGINTEFLNFYAIDSSSQWVLLGGSTTLLDATWYHVVFVETGTGMKMYLNGVEETVTANPGGTFGNTGALLPGDEAAYADTLSFGAILGSTPAAYFDGDIRFPIIFDKALSEAEVKKLYQETYINEE